VATLGKIGEWMKVDAGDNRPLFVRATDAKDVKGAKPTGIKDVQWQPMRDPPKIELAADASAGGIVADGDKYTLSGTVSSSKTLLDVYVLVNDQKVYFKSANDAEAGPNGGVKVKFQADVPLKEGNNNILVVARETADFASRKSLVVRRRPAAIAQKLGAGATTVKQQ
jgi:carboxyl-terminal processing protease